MPAELKALPRKAAARTREALQTTIGRLPDASDPAERRNYPENAVDASDAADML